MRGNGIEPKRLRVAYSAAASEGVFVLAEGVKGAGEEAAIMPPLFIYREDGGYTREIEDILAGPSLITSAFV